jgi:hypothetical protein
MALEVEGIVVGGMNAQKALRRCGRFKALHLALAPACQVNLNKRALIRLSQYGRSAAGLGSWLLY